MTPPLYDRWRNGLGFHQIFASFDRCGISLQNSPAIKTLHTHVGEDALPNERSVSSSRNINHLKDSRISGHEDPRLAYTWGRFLHLGRGGLIVMDGGLNTQTSGGSRRKSKQRARTLPLVGGTLVPLDFRRTWLNGAVIFLTKLSVREIRGF